MGGGGGHADSGVPPVGAGVRRVAAAGVAAGVGVQGTAGDRALATDPHQTSFPHVGHTHGHLLPWNQVSGSQERQEHGEQIFAPVPGFRSLGCVPRDRLLEPAVIPV